jgi:hypothetical protein
MKSTAKGLLVMSIAVVFGTACGSGMGKEVRTDIQGRMAFAQPALGFCYADALKRKYAEGTLQVAFEAEPNTGRFSKVSVKTSEIPDQQLQRCVIQVISKLKLSKPQKTVVAVDSYPIRFSAIR